MTQFQFNSLSNHQKQISLHDAHNILSLSKVICGGGLLTAAGLYVLLCAEKKYVS